MPGFASIRFSPSSGMKRATIENRFPSCRAWVQTAHRNGYLNAEGVSTCFSAGSA
nr:hypothetical protein [Escherichia coli]